MGKKEQPSLLWRAMYGAAKPGALKHVGRQLEYPAPIMAGLLSTMAINDYINPYLSKYNTSLNLGNQTIDYRPSDKYSFSLGEKYGNPKLGMKINF